MFKYNNTHIFTGYLKQLLSSFNLPTCKIYTHEFASYLEQHGEEDPRVLESFDVIDKDHLAVRINYLKNNELYNYFSTKPCITQVLNTDGTPAIDKDKKEIYKRNSLHCFWERSSDVFYDSDKTVHGLTHLLNSPGNTYDAVTHEYLGDYLRFLRDYYNINLMSLYNCFNDKIYNNIYYRHKIRVLNDKFDDTKEEDSSTNPRYLTSYRIFNSQDTEYRIYAIPVKLFASYTIAVDCSQGLELFCGLYNTHLDTSYESVNLATKTYVKIGKTLFNQPFLYDKLTVNNWPLIDDFSEDGSKIRQKTGTEADTFTRWDIAKREKDLKLFIKIPTSCKSSITILEGDYRGFNDALYTTNNNKLVYRQNYSVLNFSTKDGVALNNYSFKPVGKIQLLAFNTGESYPFADRLVEYLSGSAITPIDAISDNIKRVQRVMNDNKTYFNIEGLWEDKMQNILYGYITSSGPIESVTVGADRSDPDNYGKPVTKDYTYKTKQVPVDRRRGMHPRLGYTSKSTMYDILGYVDKDTEKLYSSWKIEDGRTIVKNNIQNVDIYNGLYDI
jgi:hypothetical protein